MRRETALAGGAAVVLSGTLLTVALVPGILAQPADGNLQQSYLTITETTVSAGHVGGATATLELQTGLEHRGGAAENVTVRARAYDADSGLLVDERVRELGTVDEERERVVAGELTVAREGSYRLETVVFEDGQRAASASTKVSGVDGLQPDYARSAVQFQRFAAADIPTVQYSVASADGDRVTLDVRNYLTNGGDEQSGDLRLVVAARQAESNIVADEASVTVSSLRPGRTDAPSVSLTVPSGYNYYLDAVLMRDGVIVDTTRSAANLDPAETLSVNETRREVGLEVEDFDASGSDRGRSKGPTYTASTEGPGFGVAAALAALLATVALSRRWSA